MRIRLRLLVVRIRRLVRLREDLVFSKGNVAWLGHSYIRSSRLLCYAQSNLGVVLIGTLLYMTLKLSYEDHHARLVARGFIIVLLVVAWPAQHVGVKHSS